MDEQPKEEEGTEELEKGSHPEKVEEEEEE